MALDHVLFLGEDIIKIKIVPTALAQLVASGHSWRFKPLAPFDNVFIQFVGELVREDFRQQAATGLGRCRAC